MRKAALYSGGSSILIIEEDDVRCRHTETGLQLVEPTRDRVHDFNKQGEYIGSSPA
jgi:hypothetical protein